MKVLHMKNIQRNSCQNQDIFQIVTKFWWSALWLISKEALISVMVNVTTWTPVLLERSKRERYIMCFSIWSYGARAEESGDVCLNREMCFGG